MKYLLIDRKFLQIFPCETLLEFDIVHDIGIDIEEKLMFRAYFRHCLQSGRAAEGFQFPQLIVFFGLAKKHFRCMHGAADGSTAQRFITEYSTVAQRNDPARDARPPPAHGAQAPGEGRGH